MAKRDKNHPADAPGNVELSDEDAAEYARLVAEWEAAGNTGVMPWPDSIPIEDEVA